MSDFKPLHYFDEVAAPPDDFWLNVAKQQGYVPPNCLLGGETVMGLVNRGDDPCRGCAGPREICGGRQ